MDDGVGTYLHSSWYVQLQLPWLTISYKTINDVLSFQKQLNRETTLAQSNAGKVTIGNTRWRVDKGRVS